MPAHRAAVLALVIVLAACVSRYDENALSDLLLVDPAGGATPYLEAIGGLPTVGAAGDPLPLGRVWIGFLGDETRWLAAYDFDRNDILDRAEITQAWLIRTAQLSTGRAVPPDGLRRKGNPAAPVRGLHLSRRGQRAVRAALEQTRAGAAHLRSVEDVIAQASGGGDDESMEDEE